MKYHLIELQGLRVTSLYSLSNSHLSNCQRYTQAHLVALVIYPLVIYPLLLSQSGAYYVLELLMMLGHCYQQMKREQELEEEEVAWNSQFESACGKEMRSKWQGCGYCCVYKQQLLSGQNL